MSARFFAFTWLVFVLPRAAEAQSLRTTYQGQNPDGNAIWQVEVLPRVQTPAGSLAVELPLTVTGATVAGAVVSKTTWPYDNPGHNPFTMTVTEGLYTASNAVFLAAGSDPVATGAAVPVLQVTTQPANGRIVLAWRNAIVAQADASVEVCGSARVALYSADFDKDGDVDGRDFLVWQRNGGNAADLALWQAQSGSQPLPPITADFDVDGDVDGRDFLIWQRNAGKTSGANQCSGDADGDGDVDGNDRSAWETQYGT